MLVTCVDSVETAIESWSRIKGMVEFSFFRMAKQHNTFTISYTFMRNNTTTSSLKVLILEEKC